MIERMFDMMATMAPTELVVAIAESQRQESMLVAQRLADVAELLAQRTNEVEAEDPDPGFMMVTGFQRATAEVAAACNLSPAAASIMVSHADTLAERLPEVAAVLAVGDTDWRTVQVIITRTEFVADSVMAGLDANLAQRISKWHCWSRRRIVNAVDATVRGMDPDAVRERVRQEDRRHVDVIAVGDGTAKVDGIIAADAAATFDRRLNELAAAVCRNDPRSTAQRRADAVKALAEGRRLACECGNDACPHRSVDAVAPTRMVINVVAGAETVLGGGSQPGYLEGYGVIDAEQVRQLAEDATLRLVEEPAVSGAEALRYQPSAALERAVRLRDMTCRFPGCDRPAAACDLDHTVPFNHADPGKGGATVAHNLKCLCRQHHRLKTFHQGWRDEQLPDGTVIWTSPTGQTYRTSPGGVELFPDMRRSLPAANRNQSAATGLVNARPGSPASASVIESSGRSTRHTVDCNKHADARSTTAKPRNRMRKTAVPPQRPTQHQPLLQLGQRPTRTRRAATRLATTP